jgi:uncharacterized protein
MPQRITATPAALDLLERLRAEHGDLIVHISGGCCDGSSPMCLRAADLPASPHDVTLGALADVPIVIDGDQDRRWLHPGFHLDAAPGAAGGFSLEALEDVHFTAVSGDPTPTVMVVGSGSVERSSLTAPQPLHRSDTRRPRSPARISAADRRPTPSRRSHA